MQMQHGLFVFWIDVFMRLRVIEVSVQVALVSSTEWLLRYV